MATVEKIYYKEEDMWRSYGQLMLKASDDGQGKKGVSFISLDGYKRLREDEVKGFCHTRFKANFVVDGIDVSQLTIGGLLQVGEATVEITQVSKDCLPKCPIIVDTNTSCKVNHQAFYGRVVKEGLVQEKDPLIEL